MKAAVLTRLNTFELMEIPMPYPQSEEVVVKVSTASICGSDIHKMQKEWKYGYPMVMGHEISGTITRIGDKVSCDMLGKKVVVIPFIPCDSCLSCRAGNYQLCDNYQMIGSHRFGGFGEYLGVPKTNVLVLEQDIPTEKAVFLEPLAVAAHGVIGIKPELGDTAAVFGLGTIGMLTMQWLKLAGVKTIIGIDIDEQKLPLAAVFGATHTIDAKKQNVVSEILSLTGKVGVSIAMECAGSQITEEQCLLVVEKGGKIGYQGIAYTDISLKQQAFENIFRRELTIKGFWNAYSSPFPGREWHCSKHFLENGQFPVEQLISHTFKLNEIQKAFDLAVHKQVSYNKIMIDFS